MPVNKEDKISVTIVGGGISGIAQAIHLKRRLGDKLELHIFEKKNEAGGVWRDSQWVRSDSFNSCLIYFLSLVLVSMSLFTFTSFTAT